MLMLGWGALIGVGVSIMLMLGWGALIGVGISIMLMSGVRCSFRVN